MVSPDKLFGRLGNRMFQMAYIYSQVRDGKIPDIYIQEFSLFENYEEDIKKWFGDGIGFVPYVGIHVRRGDYVSNSFYIDLIKTDYYRNAVKLFPNKKFIIFSDDIGLCKEYFIGDEFSFSEGNDEVTDMNLMASCESQIIANSSFSAWAAYLNPNPSKTVVYPQYWFTDNVQRVKLPTTWIPI